MDKGDRLLKPTALIVLFFVFLGAISGCGGPAFRYLEDPAPRSGSQQAQAKIDRFIKELEEIGRAHV